MRDVCLFFVAPPNRAILTKERPKQPETAKNSPKKPETAQSSVYLALRAPNGCIWGGGSKEAALRGPNKHQKLKMRSAYMHSFPHSFPRLKFTTADLSVLTKRNSKFAGLHSLEVTYGLAFFDLNAVLRSVDFLNNARK